VFVWGGRFPKNQTPGAVVSMVEGPFFLGLERRWSRSLGNDIRLYLLQLEGPTAAG